MDAKSVLDLYRKVRGMPQMQVANLALVTDRLDSAQEALTRLVDLSPAQGWVAFQSANRAFTDGAVPEMDADTGLILAVEAVDSDGVSLHIRYDGAGGWIVSRYVEKPGSEYLRDDVFHIAAEDLGKLRYRRYWRPGASHGVEPFAACFVGFEKE